MINKEMNISLLIYITKTVTTTNLLALNKGYVNYKQSNKVIK